MTRRVAFVTGGGRGIGEATVRQLCQDGFHVVVADLNEENANRVATSLTEAGHSAEAIALDVTNHQAFGDAAQEVYQKHGNISAMVHAAMQVTYTPIGDFEPAAIEKSLSIGLTSAFWAVKAALPAMRAAGEGSIVLFSSPAATRGVPGSSAYSAAKGGISSLVWQLAGELGPEGIRVNGMIPGAVPTEGAMGVVDEKGYEARKNGNALRRLGRPEDIAHGVSYLLSPAASYVNGHLLAVDGRLI